ncbi:hypothetical protein GOP47_0001115 [Adiantum capillus-veneris]|uniref:Uncharacterized protein n=1 Tax=Adiantum capillus-veneris TaxID=13818 RepID=A0A9D4VE84_ADICA|nr:hypothetical protein GOP47_0001115 [Adiantum capillus-veneris]
MQLEPLPSLLAPLTPVKLLLSLTSTGCVSTCPQVLHGHSPPVLDYRPSCNVSPQTGGLPLGHDPASLLARVPPCNLQHPPLVPPTAVQPSFSTLSVLDGGLLSCLM